MKLPSASVARPIQQMQTPHHAGARMQFVFATVTLAVLVLTPKGHSLQAQDATPPNLPNGRMRAPRPSQFSTLPPTPPTSQPGAPPAGTPTTVSTPPAANALPAPMAATPLNASPAVTRAQRAQIVYRDGQLNIRANDSSLNQILRGISRETGLKITGGVADQRVFGNYGPASLAAVLSTLLDGTGTNILLLEGDASTPPELNLTVRGGGPTPPNPNAPGFDDGMEPPPTPIQEVQITTPQPSQGQQVPVSGPQPIPQPENNINGSPNNTTPTASQIPTVQSIPTDAIATPSTAPSVSGIVDSTNPPPAGSTTASPTGAQPATTPEQIYQQLLKMQQQQTPAPPATPVNPQP